MVSLLGSLLHPAKVLGALPPLLRGVGQTDEMLAVLLTALLHELGEQPVLILEQVRGIAKLCLLYTSPSPRDS